MPVPKQHTIVVTGDVTMDWNLAHARHVNGSPGGWSASDVSNLFWQRGGAALLADLVAAVAGRLERPGEITFSIRQTGAPCSPLEVHPEDRRFHHSYAMWAPFKVAEKGLAEREAWRVDEMLGFDLADRATLQEWQKIEADDPKSDLLILDDADLGFRDQPELWPVSLQAKGKHRPWILLKMSRPLAKGNLWERLHLDWNDRLILVATVDDLRLSEVQISRALSWERTAQDIFWELVHNPCINSLSRCAHVVISFGPAGAILLSPRGKSQTGFDCTLFFDPKFIEGMWEQDQKGGMIGYTTCLTGGIAREILLSPDKPDIDAGICAGLAALRTLHLEGYGSSDPTLPPKVVFPLERIVEALGKPAFQFSRAVVQDPMRFIHQKAAVGEMPLQEGYWTILKDRYSGNLDEVAERVVREGPQVALRDVPWGQFGNLLTVDRQEIESYRSIRNLVSEYAGMKQPSRPLSIAVFGTPGSGKSFGVTEMAKSLLPGQIETITFNLSQFDSVEALTSALHQVRDIGLGGKIPLVFWDEFDTALEGKPLGWLRYFLAPMQDGRFQEGQLSHPIGRAIFVFAGGTSARMAEFDKGGDPEFRKAKGPDFISRLKGFINILGPNPLREGQGDPYFILRRAILLRSTLLRNAPAIFSKQEKKEILNIDPGVLRAFLHIDEFKHGARSIEALISMSQLAGKPVFERSCLPPEAQLDLHVDGKKFLSLVQQLELDGTTLENLAEAAHDVYREGLKKPVEAFDGADMEGRERYADYAYANLPEEMKEANRFNVRGIPAKLAAAGYIMIPARSNEPPFNFPGAHLEILAQEEHERWMSFKLASGWTYAPERDEVKKLHPCLVAWEQLPEAEREKDRSLVRGIPEILARAGFTVLKVS